MRVFSMLRWPSQSWTKTRSPPAESMCVAIECFRQWKGRLSWGRPAFAVPLHEPVERPPGDRDMTPAREQDRRARRPRAEVRLQHPDLVRLEGVLTEVAALEPVVHQTEALKVEVVRVKEPHLACTEAVPVSDEEDGAVALVADHAEERLQLLGRQEADGSGSGGRAEGGGYCSELPLLSSTVRLHRRSINGFLVATHTDSGSVVGNTHPEDRLVDANGRLTFKMTWCADEVTREPSPWSRLLGAAGDVRDLASRRAPTATEGPCSSAVRHRPGRCCSRST